MSTNETAGNLNLPRSILEESSMNFCYGRMDFEPYRRLMMVPKEIIEADRPSTFDQYRERVNRERMKSDEKQLRYMVIERGRVSTPTVRELGAKLGIHPKRVVALCEKWMRQGWYECGVSPDMGWVSDPDKVPKL